MNNLRLGIVIADMMLRGGGERVVATLSNYFVNQFGYSVDIFSLNRTNGEIPYRLDARVNVLDTGLDLEVSPLIAKTITRLKSVVAIRRYLASRELDFVIGVGTYPNVVLGLVASERTTRIGYEQVAFDVCPKNWQILRRLTYPRLDGVISLTEKDRIKLARLNRNSTCIPNCTDFAPQRSANLDSKTLLSVGRLTTQKGFDILLQVFARIHRLRPEWKLKIVGDGEEKAALVSTVHRLSLADSVSVCPGTREIEAEYLNASIYVMTSRWEGFPLVLLEAQACGLPVVSFDCPTGPAQVLSDGVNGYLISAFDQERMVERLLELIDNRARRSDFSQQAVVNADKYSVDNVARRWRSVFETSRKRVHAYSA